MTSLPQILLHQPAATESTNYIVLLLYCLFYARLCIWYLVSLVLKIPFKLRSINFLKLFSKVMFNKDQVAVESSRLL